MKSHKVITGLLTCKHCQHQLVVSWSGHYVRDPFALQRLTTGRMLRRASHPLARLYRDVAIAAQPLVLAALGSIVMVGMLWTSLTPVPMEGQLQQNKLLLEEKIEPRPNP